MKRVKKHRIKREMPESSQTRNEEHDLAYYIHDRVELMHQVFSVMKHKELKAMAPECVRNISLDDLQELCTEELLGISSKRLCSILDGADPPSNTESSSSSPERMETISLDSISSDDEILSQDSSKKSKKHKHHRHSKAKSKAKGEDVRRGEAARAGLTVLELLELQARARAIRAQLQQHHLAVPAEQADAQVPVSDDDEVVIKEEAPEVVEISSEDEKPSLHDLKKKIDDASKETPPDENTKTVTKRINDLIITVPQAKTTRRIKLNRPKANPSNDGPVTATCVSPPKGKDAIARDGFPGTKDKRSKKKQKKKGKEKDKDGSDHDEITLQLSDSEKMDLLEDLHRKTVSTEDSESSSDSSGHVASDLDSKERNDVHVNTKDTLVAEKIANLEIDKREMLKVQNDPSKNDHEMEMVEDQEREKDLNTSTDVAASALDTGQESVEVSSIQICEEASTDESKNESLEMSTKRPLQSNSAEKADVEEGEITNKELSDGELSEESAEAKAQKANEEVVFISDDENASKKKKKKEKKSKKSKKSDFRESADENFFKVRITVGDPATTKAKEDAVFKREGTDDVLEYFELSDDSSCYEVEGVSVLSKEPTTEEIVALSAKIDEMERVEVVTEEEIRDHESLDRGEGDFEKVENISWKDRYLESKKVKSVLNTANIFNALRKKNKELKKKIELSKKENVPVRSEGPEVQRDDRVVEGSIDHFNTLQGSTTFVDPIREPTAEGGVMKEMEKDAKQLLKMYKKLLKYNDINRKKDPNRRKKKKQKKSKERGSGELIN